MLLRILLPTLTIAFWTNYWWWWLLFVLCSWLVLELLSILDGHLSGSKNIYDWTLSDTIRRWSVAYRWLAPATVGLTACLLWHFFGQ